MDETRTRIVGKEVQKAMRAKTVVLGITLDWTHVFELVAVTLAKKCRFRHAFVASVPIVVVFANQSSVTFSTKWSLNAVWTN